GHRRQQCRDFLHQAAGGDHARRFRPGHRHQPDGAVSHRPGAPPPSGQAGEWRPGDHRFGLRPRRAPRLGRLRGQQVRPARDARLHCRRARGNGGAGHAGVAGAGGYGDLGPHRPRFQDGLYQAEGHDARRGRGGGCRVRGYPSGADFDYGDSPVAHGILGEGMNASRFPLPFVICAAVPLTAQIPQLPDSTGWGVHVLALARAPDSAIWAGTYGQGIFVLRPHATAWEHISESDDTSKHTISWDFFHAFAFGPKGQVWYGTVGNGWGLSLDNGKTWKNWQYRELGPEWQYVAPNGIATRGDTTYIATADGLKITCDDGLHWLVVTDSMGATTSKDSVIGRIRNQYLLAIILGDGGNMWVSELTGIAHSPDDGRTWHEGFVRPPCVEVGCANRARSFSSDSQGVLWVRTEEGVFKFAPQFGGWKTAADSMPKVALPLSNWEGPRPKIVAPPAGPPSAFRHTWFRRPIDLADQPYIDQTYRFGSTMGGNFQAHQGVEFNNPDGTPVHAIGDGVVVYSGKAEAGANTIAIRHDKKLDGQYLFSVYYHNS